MRGEGELLGEPVFPSAPAQDGFGATQGNPAAAHPTEIHLHIYGEYKYGMD